MVGDVSSLERLQSQRDLSRSAHYTPHAVSLQTIMRKEEECFALSARVGV